MLAQDVKSNTVVSYGGTTATLIRGNLGGSEKFLLCWKTAPINENLNINPWNINDIPSWKPIFPTQFQYGWAILGSDEVSIIETTLAKPTGMYCASKYCNEFNPYAAPNQPDGKTYYCYTCKSKPSWAR
jgi:hypothetical protein